MIQPPHSALAPELQNVPCPSDFGFPTGVSFCGVRVLFGAESTTFSSASCLQHQHRSNTPMLSILTKLKELVIARRAPRVCWLALLPVELQIKLLLTVASQRNGNVSAVMLGRAVPELGKLILVVYGPDYLHHPAYDTSEIMYTYLSEYATLAQEEYRQRPVRLFFAGLQENHMFPSILLDGGPHSMISRYITDDTPLSIWSLTDQTSLLLLAPRGSWLKTPADQTRKRPMPVVVDYQELQGLTMESPHKVAGITFRPVKFGCVCSGARQNSLVAIDFHKRRLRSLVVQNCSNQLHIVAPLDGLLDMLEIRLNAERSPEWDEEPNTPPLVCLKDLPRRVLHVTFESCAVPHIYLCLPRQRNNASRQQVRLQGTLILQNVHWSYANPYGLIKSNDMDQAAYNARVALHWQQQGYPHDRCFSFSDDIDSTRYEIMRFYGVPDSTLVRNFRHSLHHVRHIFWWRLSTRTVNANDEVNAPTLDSPALDVLHITSVIKTNEQMPRFCLHGGGLSELALISLHDSDVALYPASVFAPYSEPWLSQVYLERRTDPDREPPAKLALRTPHIWFTASKMERLHVRGYVPEFAMPVGRQARFQMLRSLVLDASEISTEHGEATLSLESENFPVLLTLVLMCTREAHANDTLSTVNLRVLVGKNCESVYICHLLRPKSLTLNGQALTVDEEQYTKNPKCETPIIPSRKSQLWERSPGDGARPFAYLGERLWSDWYFQHRDY